jgi:hypothetical protein
LGKIHGKEKPCLPFGKQGWKSSIVKLDEFLLPADLIGLRAVVPAYATGVQSGKSGGDSPHQQMDGQSRFHEWRRQCAERDSPSREVSGCKDTGIISSLVGDGALAPSAPRSSGATNVVIRAWLVIRSARYYSGEGIATRCRCLSKGIRIEVVSPTARKVSTLLERNEGFSLLAPMKFSQQILCCFAAGLAFSATAQQQFPVKFRGTSTATNESGQVVTGSFNSQTLIDECSEPGDSPLALVYVLNADGNGDMIKVIDPSDGSVRCETFRLYVPTINNVFDGQYVFISNKSQTRVKQLYYMFGTQASTSVGTVLLDKQFEKDRNGNTNRVTIIGEFRYFRLPEGDQGVRIRSGTLTVRQKIQN